MTTYTHTQTTIFRSGPEEETTLSIIADSRPIDGGDFILGFGDIVVDGDGNVVGSLFEFDPGILQDVLVDGRSTVGDDGLDEWDLLAYNSTWTFAGQDQGGLVLEMRYDPDGDSDDRTFLISVSGDPIPLDRAGIAEINGTVEFGGRPTGAVTIEAGALPTPFEVDEADVLRGTGAAEVWRLGDGDDVAYGRGGADRIFGERGADTLFGNGGADRLVGQAGADTLFGNRGADALIGNNGRDFLRGGGGDDVLRGGRGIDTLLGNQGRDKLFGQFGNDVMNGGNGNDRLLGGNGSDAMNGGRNADVLKGQGGSDTLNGGGGRDTLVGGRGSDVFVFSRGRDVVRDLESRDIVSIRGDYSLETNRAGDVVLVGKGGRMVFEGIEDEAFVAAAIVDDLSF